jgi:hypothetical protein
MEESTSPPSSASSDWRSCGARGTCQEVAPSYMFWKNTRFFERERRCSHPSGKSRSTIVPARASRPPSAGLASTTPAVVESEKDATGSVTRVSLVYLPPPRARERRRQCGRRRGRWRGVGRGVGERGADLLNQKGRPVALDS